MELFEDTWLGGFFFYGKDVPELIVRPKSGFDGAIPSGNSAAALALMRLAQLTANNEFFEHGFKTVKTFSNAMQTHALAMTQMLIAADFALGPRRQIVIAGSQNDQNTRQMVDIVHQKFMPRTVVMLRASDSYNSALCKINPYIRSQKTAGGKPVFYLCENFTCSKPLTEPDEVRLALENKEKQSV